MPVQYPRTITEALTQQDHIALIIIYHVTLKQSVLLGANYNFQINRDHYRKWQFSMLKGHVVLDFSLFFCSASFQCTYL